jgi:rhamnulokinase
MNPRESAYVAVDLGAGSGRVVVARLQPDQFLMEEVRRFHYEPIFNNGRLEWPGADIFGELKAGLRQAAVYAHDQGATVTSIGIDSWGVDYGLIDAEGDLVENPVCYRDRRTEPMMEKVFKRVPREEIYARTGIQCLAFNTLFQLASHVEAGLPPSATRLLLIPDLFHFLLTGRAVTEYTNATTTQLLRSNSGQWDIDLMERLGLPTYLLGEIVPAGTRIGSLKPQIAAELELDGVDVVAPATHDTGSAVIGTPFEKGAAFISSGTWSLAGVELDAPLINPDTARHNFTNEGGAFSTTRFLKNVMGLWILESCRKEWADQNLNVPYDALLHDLNPDEPSRTLLFPDDQRFFAPGSMLSAIAAQVDETGQSVPIDPVACAKAILDSLAFRCASVVRTIERLNGTAVREIHIVGGGSRNDYLNQNISNASGLPVAAGPVEATAIGNILVQAIHAGRFKTLQEGRRYVGNNMMLKHFMPRRARAWEEAQCRYAEIEARYTERSA